MISRLINLPKDQSFFLFGARGTGKTTLLKALPWLKDCLMINLLKASTENRFARDPDELSSIVNAMPKEQTHIVIDEVQKLPKLLDIVHDLIENTDKKFILTRSSARKLKNGGANLLAGRAFTYHLYPFSFLEIQDKFDLLQTLQYGTLPKIFEFTDNVNKQFFLETYTNVYLKEEIWAEKLIRDLAPFRYFLEVAAQANGKIINFSNISRDVGVSDHTVKEYFSILEDTLLGYTLPAFQHSFRKRLNKKPKFYFFDTGVVRALMGLTEVPLTERTHGFGNAFEHFIISECKRLANYYHRNYRFSYLSTKDSAEIDLVVERPGKGILLVEIKSTDHVKESHLSTLESIKNDLGDCEAICLSRDPHPKKMGNITVFPWQDGIKKYFVS